MRPCPWGGWSPLDGLRVGFSEAGVKAVYADSHLSQLVNINGEDRQLGVEASILIRQVDTLYCFFYRPCDVGLYVNCQSSCSI